MNGEIEPDFSHSYADTYRIEPPDCSSDAAIARALAADGPPPPPPPPPDTSHDHALALQIHSDEVDRLCGHAPPDVDTASGHLDRLVRAALSGSRLLKLVPRLNPVAALSSAAAGLLTGQDAYSGGDHITPERARLLHRLKFYGLVEKRVAGDGNCQFRALSDQLYRSPSHHEAVRARVAAQLRARRGRYAPYVPGDYGAYVAGMATLGTWGDHVTLQAAADAWGVSVYVLTSFAESCVIEITPEVPNPAYAARALHLSFWAEIHYNSVYPAAAAAAPAAPAPPAHGRLSPRALLQHLRVGMGDAMNSWR